MYRTNSILIIILSPLYSKSNGLPKLSEYIMHFECIVFNDIIKNTVKLLYLVPEPSIINNYQ